MARDVAVSVQGISKRYRIGREEKRKETLTQEALAFLRSPLARARELRRLTRFDDEDQDDVLWALRDVSFEVARGEVVGIVGHNGAGKSTLLRILSSITSPTTGRVVLHGQVSSLLEVGTGFHPELSGRDNVYLNGAILGLTRREIRERFASIVAFSGVEGFLDTPVKRYSSGMRVRLAFSVAAHLEPEILLIDEVLAVGDSSFQQKCLGKMREVASGGRTVLFVSHNLAAVGALCRRTILLDHGRVAEIGLTRRVLERYLASLATRTEVDLRDRRDRSGSGTLRVVAMTLRGAGGEPVDVAQCGAAVEVRLRFEALRPHRHVTFSIGVFDSLGALVTTLWTEYTGDSLDELPAAAAEAVCEVPRLPLMPGRYSLSFSVRASGVVTDSLENALVLQVVPGDFFGSGRTPKPRGMVLVPHRWRLEGEATS